jgi:hypothetical protein
MIFTNSAFSVQVYVKHAEFNENPRHDLVVDTSQPDGHDVDIRRLTCTSDICGGGGCLTACSLLCKTPCRLLYTLLAVGAVVRKLSTEHSPTNVFCTFQNAHSNCSYDCTPSTVNVFETGITLPDRSQVSLAATTPCRLQLFAQCYQL